MFQYIFQVVLFQLLFLVIYDGFLKRETFFNHNRIYLLATVILSFLLPFVQLGIFENTMPQQLIIKLPEVVIGALDAESAGVTVQGTTQSINENIWQWHYIIYIGMMLATLIFITKLVRLVWLIENNPKRWQGDILLIKLIKSSAAFSFFNRVFMGENISQHDQQTILRHEMVHVQHKHSLDLLIFEILRIVMWFNPLVYLYQNRIIAVHEFIADAEATKHQDKQVYYQNLLAQVFDTNKISFINPFYKQSLIKKRIVMLSKSKSIQLHLIKYALLIPMVVGMLMYTSSQAQEIKTTETTQNMSEEEMLEKYFQEILERKKAGENFLELFDDFILEKKEIYISNKADYIKFIAFTKYLNEKSKERNTENKSATVDSPDINFEYKTYNEYSEWKQTDEAKKVYENITSDKSFRMVVNDVNYLTDIENIRKNEYLNNIKNDINFDTLILADLKGETLFLQTDRSSSSGNGIGLYSGGRNTDNFDEIPYAVVERVPAFEGCEDLPTNQQLKECTSQSITAFVNKNFDTTIGKKAGLKGRQRINVVFKINTDGEIVEVRARAPHPDLEVEAKRVVESIPALTPGMQKGKNITVQYALPIIFQVL